MNKLRAYLNGIFKPAAVNFWCYVCEGVFGNFGMEIVAVSVVFPLLAAELGASETQFGWLVSISSIAFITPLFFMRRFEQVRRKKRLALLIGIGGRLPILLNAFILLIMAPRWPLACLLAITFMGLLRHVGGIAAMPLQLALISETIEDQRRGKLFGIRFAFAAIVGLGSGAAAKLIIQNYSFPLNYALLYFFAASAALFSWLSFSMVDESPPQPHQEHIDRSTYMKSLLKGFWKNYNARLFVIFQVFSSLGAPLLPFYTFAATQYHGIDKAFAAAALIIADNTARIFGNFFFSFISNTIGYRWILILKPTFYCLAALLAALAPSGYWFIAVMFIAGMGASARNVAEKPFTMQIASKEKIVGYMTIFNVTAAPMHILAAPFVGTLMGTLGHRPVFFACACLLALGAVPLLRVKTGHRVSPELQTVN